MEREFVNYTSSSTLYAMTANYQHILDGSSNVVRSIFFEDPDWCLDEVVEIFNQQLMDRNYSKLYYPCFMRFLIEKQLYNKKISLEHVEYVFEKYIGVEQKLVKYNRTSKAFCETPFYEGLVQYDIWNEEDEWIWETFIELLKELNF